MSAIAGANAMRRKAYGRMMSRALLDPTSPRTLRERLWEGESRYLPRFGTIWTALWTPAARAAFYGLPL